MSCKWVRHLSNDYACSEVSLQGILVQYAYIGVQGKDISSGFRCVQMYFVWPNWQYVFLSKPYSVPKH